MIRAAAGDAHGGLFLPARLACSGAGYSTNEIGTTITQWDALRAIARHPGASAHELAGETFQSDQAFGTLASRLVAQKLIERHPGWGRRIEHHLTAAGERMLAAGHPIADAVLGESFAALTEPERAQLLALLRTLNG